MKLLAWGAENFFRYEKFELQLKELGRLVLIEGKNHDFATASSNGAGKSSLVEILSCALFGKTLRTVDGKDSIIRPGAKQCQVWVKAELPEGDLLIERWRGRETFVKAALNGDDVVRGRTVSETDDRIEKLLGFDYDLFRRTVVFHSRITESFASLNDRYLKSISERLLGMPDFKVTQDAIKLRLGELGLRAEKLVSRAGMAMELLADRRSQLEQYKTLQQKAEADSKAKIKKAKAELGQAEADVESLAGNVAAQKQVIANNEEAVKARQVRLAELEAENQAVLSELNKTVGRLTVLAAAKEKYLKLRDSKTCPECGQKVTASMMERRIDGLGVEVSRCEGEKAGLVDKLKKQSAGLKTHKADFDLAQITLGDKRSELARLTAKLEAAISATLSAKALVEDLQKSAQNQYGPVIADAEAAINSLERKVDKLKSKAVKISKLTPYYEFWKFGFGPDGIRSYALDGITPVLNRLANMYLEQLTDGTMAVELSTVSQNKDGSYRDRFQVAVENSGGAPGLSGDSDGEIACCDLALNLAMSDLLDSRIPGGIGLLFIDQQLDLLDEVRGAKAIRLLNQRTDEAWCKERGLLPKRNVFVISHRNEIKDQFANVINVEKRDGICRVVS